MKLMPVHQGLSKHKSINQTIIHSGQHYDSNMSDIFFQQLDIPTPDHNLCVGSGPHGWQTAETLKKIEKILIEDPPDLLLVYGDVNSTAAGSLAAKKLQIDVAHVESGLRSKDRTMPEEINRIVTDHISDLLFCPSYDAIENLKNEGLFGDQVHMVGNVMIDTLVSAMSKIKSIKTYETLGLEKHGYGVVTLHRPSNVDIENSFIPIIDSLNQIGSQIPLVFPAHPRTKLIIDEITKNKSLSSSSNIVYLDPLGYMEFISLVDSSMFVITDSGGIQEETTYLNIPCLTLRDSTERPVTVDVGSNILVGTDVKKLEQEVNLILKGTVKTGNIPAMWDGNSGERISEIILK